MRYSIFLCLAALASHGAEGRSKSWLNECPNFAPGDISVAAAAARDAALHLKNMYLTLSAGTRITPGTASSLQGVSLQNTPKEVTQDFTTDYNSIVTFAIFADEILYAEDRSTSVTKFSPEMKTLADAIRNVLCQFRCKLGADLPPGSFDTMVERGSMISTTTVRYMRDYIAFTDSVTYFEKVASQYTGETVSCERDNSMDWRGACPNYNVANVADGATKARNALISIDNLCKSGVPGSERMQAHDINAVKDDHLTNTVTVSSHDPQKDYDAVSMYAAILEGILEDEEQMDDNKWHHKYYYVVGETAAQTAIHNLLCAMRAAAFAKGEELLDNTINRGSFVDRDFSPPTQPRWNRDHIAYRDAVKFLHSYLNP